MSEWVSALLIFFAGMVLGGVGGILLLSILITGAQEPHDPATCQECRDNR